MLKFFGKPRKRKKRKDYIYEVTDSLRKGKDKLIDFATLKEARRYTHNNRFKKFNSKTGRINLSFHQIIKKQKKIK